MAGQAHRHGRELPEVGHQPGVGVGRQAVAGAVLDLLAEPVELLLGQPALEEGAGVDAGGAVALDVDLVAAAGVVLAAEEVVEADLVEAGGGLVRRDVAADLEALAVGAGHDDRGVPADERADPALDLLVAGEPRLALGRDRVDVVGAAQRRDADLPLAGPLEQPQHDVAGALAAALVDACRRRTPASRWSRRGRCPGAGWGGLRGSRRAARSTAVAGPRSVVVSSLTCPSSHAARSRGIYPAVARCRRLTSRTRWPRVARPPQLRWTTAHLSVPHPADAPTAARRRWMEEP